MSKHEDLHRLHDGELSDEERRAVEASLDDDARLRLQAMADLGTALRGSFEAESAGVDVSAAVMAAIAKGAPARAAAPSLWARLRAAARSYRMVWIPAVAAAAVVTAIYVGPWRTTITNECNIESLEVEGAAATVLKVPDAQGGDGTTTVVWIDEGEEESK